MYWCRGAKEITNRPREPFDIRICSIPVPFYGFRLNQVQKSSAKNRSIKKAPTHTCARARGKRNGKMKDFCQLIAQNFLLSPWYFIVRNIRYNGLFPTKPNRYFPYVCWADGMCLDMFLPFMDTIPFHMQKSEKQQPQQQRKIRWTQLKPIFGIFFVITVTIVHFITQQQDTIMFE